MADVTCRGCTAPDVVPVVDLGPQPGSDHFPDAAEPGQDQRWPLELWLCRRCLLVQLGPVQTHLPAPPLGVESATSKAHARGSVRDLDRELGGFDGWTVAEFASHHGGSWLGPLATLGARPAQGDHRADLVVDVHGLAHEQDVAAAWAARAARLALDGVLVLEFHHLLPLVLEGQFDTVRHGHWSYLSLVAVANLAARQGLEVLSARAVPVFGGSLRVLLGHRDGPRRPDGTVAEVLSRERAEGLDDPGRLVRLQTGARASALALGAFLRTSKHQGRTVLGYGAPSKAPVLLGLSQVGPDLLPFTVDAAPGKHGRRVPGCGVPIRPVQELRAARPDIVLVLTWDIADEVIAQLEADGGWGADYVLPLPSPHVVGTSAAGS